MVLCFVILGSLRENESETKKSLSRWQFFSSEEQLTSRTATCVRYHTVHWNTEGYFRCKSLLIPLFVLYILKKCTQGDRRCVKFVCCFCTVMFSSHLFIQFTFSKLGIIVLYCVVWVNILRIATYLNVKVLEGTELCVMHW